MDECEQVEKKVDLTVRTVSDSTDPSSDSIESQPALKEEELLPSATDADVVQPSETDSNSPEPLSSDSLQKHLSAYQLKPLPAHIISGASFSQALNRPLPILGQGVMLFTIVAVLAYLWAHHMLGVGSAFYFLLIPGGIAVALMIPIYAVMKMQANMLTEFLAGVMHPLTWIDKHTVPSLSAGVLGDSLQGSNNYLLAASCYGEILRNTHPVDVLTESRSFERELIISLAYAGKFKQSLFYADNAVGYADYLLATVDTGIARNYFAFATRTAAMAYELSGENAKANELRVRCYEATKDLPLSNESRLFGNLARAEAYCQTEEFEEARPLLKDFVENVSFGHKMSSDPVMKSRAYHLLATCHARLGDFEEARRMHKLGCEKGSSDLSTYVKAEGVLAEANILKFSGSTEDADSLIEKALQKMRVSPTSVIWQRLTALQSKPSDSSVSLSVHDEYEVDRSEHDDDPRPPAILADETKVINYLNRSALGLVVMVLIVFFFNKGSNSFLWFFAPMIVFSFLMVRPKLAQKNAGASAIAKGKPLLVRVKLWGFKDLYLWREDGKRYSYQALSAELTSKLQPVACDKEFNAVAYANEFGDIDAVQILGH